jgi:hypothetical protein
MTTFNKSQFLAQFASFKPSNEWEEKFSKSLHRQVEKFGKELSEKQIECWTKLITPPKVVSVESLNEDNIAQLTKCNNVLIYAQETKDIEFAKSLKSQILQGKSLSSKQSYYLGLIEKRVSPKVEAPKVEAPKAKTPKAKTPKVEAPKVETPKVEAPKAKRTTKAKVETPKVEAEVETPKRLKNWE